MQKKNIYDKPSSDLQRASELEDGGSSRARRIYNVFWLSFKYALFSWLILFVVSLVMAPILASCSDRNSMNSSCRIGSYELLQLKQLLAGITMLAFVAMIISAILALVFSFIPGVVKSEHQQGMK